MHNLNDGRRAIFAFVEISDLFLDHLVEAIVEIVSRGKILYWYFISLFSDRNHRGLSTLSRR